MTQVFGHELDELEIVQNPALGMYSIWRCTLAFGEQSGDAMPVPLAFLVLPLLFHRPTLDAINGTRDGSGISLFAAKLAGERESLIAIHGRALLLRRLTLESLGVGTSSGLLKLNYREALLRATSLPNRVQPTIPERLKAFKPASEKLGHWFERAGLAQVAMTLRVDF